MHTNTRITFKTEVVKILLDGKELHFTRSGLKLFLFMWNHDSVKWPIGEIIEACGYSPHAAYQHLHSLKQDLDFYGLAGLLCSERIPSTHVTLYWLDKRFLNGNR